MTLLWQQWFKVSAAEAAFKIPLQEPCSYNNSGLKNGCRIDLIGYGYSTYSAATASCRNVSRIRLLGSEYRYVAVATIIYKNVCIICGGGDPTAEILL
jgi:hypothetical protein